MIDTDLEQAQAKLDLLKAAAGIVDGEFIQQVARKILTDTLTPPESEPEPAKEEELYTLTITNFLATKELPHWWTAGCSRGFGRSMRTSFLERTGKLPQSLTSDDKSARVYPESARALMEEVYENKIYEHVEVFA